MPPEVDVEKRLDEIAEATLRLARDHGARGVTVRAVAKELGGSTTLVTNYVPTRKDLLNNAVEYVTRNWDIDLAKALDGYQGMEKLQALADWSLQTVDFDEAIRRLFIDGLAGLSPEMSEVSASNEVGDDEYNSIRSITDQAGLESWVADTLFLAFRGYYTLSIAQPELWTSERAQEAVRGMLEMVSRATRDESSAAGSASRNA